MRRVHLFIAAAAIAVIVGTFVLRELTRADPKKARSEAPIVRRPSGRVLYAVVDADGVYLGEERVQFQQSVAAVNAMLRRNRIRNLYIFGTTDAKYGNVVRLHAGVDQGLIDYCSFSYAPIRPGSRKPLTAIIQQGMCGPVFPPSEPVSE